LRLGQTEFSNDLTQVFIGMDRGRPLFDLIICTGQ